MKRLFVYVHVSVVLLFSAGAVFAGQGGGYGAQPQGPESGSDPRTQEARPAPGGQKSDSLTSGGRYEYGPGKGPPPEGAGSSYRQEGPKDPVKSHWQIEGGGFVGMGVGRRQ